MTMTPLKYKTVKDAALLAKFLVQYVKPRADSLNIDYDANGGVKSTLTQADLDSEASFSDITKQQVDDALYAITSVIRSILDPANGSGSYAQLEILASRAEPLPPMPSI